jgi:putative hemolysin
MLLAREPELKSVGAAARLSVAFARDAAEIEAAQRLRYRVFVEEMGARTTHRQPGVDHDMFDPWCEHLIVRDEASDEVVGTYRILTPDRAWRLGTYYAEGEFDLTRLGSLRPGICEVGRACIHPDYRTGAVISRLWHGIASVMQEREYRYLIGCASISMADGGATATRAARHVLPKHLAPIEFRVFPRHPLVPVLRDVEDGEAAAEAAVPPLLKAYLRLGAWIGGEPAWDPDFNTADLFVFLPLARITPRYARHYLRAA